MSTLAYRPAPWWRRLVGWQGLAMLVVLLGIAWSTWTVQQRTTHAADPTITTVRIMHWMLDFGYRDALQHVIDDYNHLQQQRFANGVTPTCIRVEQIAVTEKVYSQVLKVHLIAGTGPDLFTHFGDIEPARVCVPLDPWVEQPNPYHADLHEPDLDPALARLLITRPWRETFSDHLQGGFHNDLQAYYGIPTSFTIGARFAYNLDIVRAATGDERLPTTFGEVLKLCQCVRAWAKRTGSDIAPIAASAYNTNYLTGELAGVMLEPWNRVLDANHDGLVTQAEGWAAMAAGTVGFQHPVFLQYLDALKALANEFSPGFAALERDAAVHRFVQGRAAITFCSSWDVCGILALTKDRFRTRFAAIPVPGPGEPWNTPPRQPFSEASLTATLAFHVNRDGHVAEAVDFLRYWTSHAVNQRFNREAYWIPSVVGAEPAPEMLDYMPRLGGVTGGWTLASPWVGSTISGQTGLVLQGQLLALAAGEIDRDALLQRVSATYAHPAYGARDVWARSYVEARDAARNQERSLAIVQAVALGRGQPPDPRTLRDRLWGQLPLLNGSYLRWKYHTTVGATGQPFPEVEP